MSNEQAQIEEEGENEFLKNDAKKVKESVRIEQEKPVEQKLDKTEASAKTYKKMLQEDPLKREWFIDALQQFESIKKNIFLDRKRRKFNKDDDFCTCRPKEGKVEKSLIPKGVVYNCGEGCINRLMSTECTNETCQCGSLCQNRRFQKHQDALIFPKPEGDKGFGLIAGQFIKKGTFICQYIGEVFNINSEIGKQRCEEYKNSVCTYMMKISKNEVIDPTYKGSLARFINHSCDPNCQTQKWQIKGETCIGVFAVKDILMGEELSFDYGFDSFLTPLTKCLCGSELCRGYLGQKPTDMTLEEWYDHLDNMPCTICGINQDDDDDKLLLCDLCNRGFHTFCLKPPLLEIPKDAWFCSECKEKQNQQSQEDKERKEKEKIENYKKKKQKRSKKMYQESESEEEQEEEFDEEYNERFNLIKEIEDEADGRLYNMQYDTDLVSDTQKIKLKRKKKDILKKKEEQKKTLKKRKTGKRREGASAENMDIESGEELDAEKDEEESGYEEEEEEDQEMQQQQIQSKNKEVTEAYQNQIRRQSKNHEMKKLAEVKFQEYLKNHEELLEQLNKVNDEQQKNLEEGQELDENINDQKKITMLMSKIQIHLFKSNLILFENLKLNVFWDHSSSSRDLFQQSAEVTVSGQTSSVDLLQKFLKCMADVSQNVRNSLGIVEARIQIPAIYLKRIIGHNHANINRMESQSGVNIIYDKRYVNDICYSLDTKVSLLLKGQKENIIQVYDDIQEKIKSYEVHRVYLSPIENKVVSKNLALFKKMQLKSEFRLHREPPFKEVNHPFFYIPVKEKELALIGTKEENDITLKEVLEQINRYKEKEEYQSVNYLLPFYMKQKSLQIKQQIEKQLEHMKVIVNDPVLPRKNLTFSIFGPQDKKEQAIKIMENMLNQEDSANDYGSYRREGSSGFNVEEYQNKMMYQMTKYLFKYTQNTFLTYDTSFMKNWDIITPYFTKEWNLILKRDQEIQEGRVDNYKSTFYDTIKKYIINKDYDTQLYACFISKNIKMIQLFDQKRNITNLNDNNNMISPEQEMENSQQYNSNSRFIKYKEDNYIYNTISLIKRIATNMIRQNQENTLRYYKTIFDRSNLKKNAVAYNHLRDQFQAVNFYETVQMPSNYSSSSYQEEKSYVHTKSNKFTTHPNSQRFTNSMGSSTNLQKGSLSQRNRNKFTDSLVNISPNLPQNIQNRQVPQTQHENQSVEQKQVTQSKSEDQELELLTINNQPVMQGEINTILSSKPDQVSLGTLNQGNKINTPSDSENLLSKLVQGQSVNQEQNQPKSTKNLQIEERSENNNNININNNQGNNKVSLTNKMDIEVPRTKVEPPKISEKDQELEKIQKQINDLLNQKQKIEEEKNKQLLLQKSKQMPVTQQSQQTSMQNKQQQQPTTLQLQLLQFQQEQQQKQDQQQKAEQQGDNNIIQTQSLLKSTQNQEKIEQEQQNLLKQKQQKTKKRISKFGDCAVINQQETSLQYQLQQYQKQLQSSTNSQQELHQQQKQNQQNIDQLLKQQNSLQQKQLEEKVQIQSYNKNNLGENKQLNQGGQNYQTNQYKSGVDTDHSDTVQISPPPVFNNGSNFQQQQKMKADKEMSLENQQKKVNQYQQQQSQLEGKQVQELQQQQQEEQVFLSNKDEKKGKQNLQQIKINMNDFMQAHNFQIQVLKPKQSVNPQGNQNEENQQHYGNKSENKQQQIDFSQMNNQTIKNIQTQQQLQQSQKTQSQQQEIQSQQLLQQQQQQQQIQGLEKGEIVEQGQILSTQQQQDFSQQLQQQQQQQQQQKQEDQRGKQLQELIDSSSSSSSSSDEDQQNSQIDLDQKNMENEFDDDSYSNNRMELYGKRKMTSGKDEYKGYQRRGKSSKKWGKSGRGGSFSEQEGDMDDDYYYNENNAGYNEEGSFIGRDRIDDYSSDQYQQLGASRYGKRYGENINTYNRQRGYGKIRDNYKKLGNKMNYKPYHKDDTYAQNYRKKGLGIRQYNQGGFVPREPREPYSREQSSDIDENNINNIRGFRGKEREWNREKEKDYKDQFIREKDREGSSESYGKMGINLKYKGFGKSNRQTAHSQSQGKSRSKRSSPSLSENEEGQLSQDEPKNNTQYAGQQKYDNYSGRRNIQRDFRGSRYSGWGNSGYNRRGRMESYDDDNQNETYGYQRGKEQKLKRDKRTSQSPIGKRYTGFSMNPYGKEGNKDEKLNDNDSSQEKEKNNSKFKSKSRSNESKSKSKKRSRSRSKSYNNNKNQYGVNYGKQRLQKERFQGKFRSPSPQGQYKIGKGGYDNYKGQSKFSYYPSQQGDLRNSKDDLPYYQKRHGRFQQQDYYKGNYNNQRKTYYGKRDRFYNNQSMNQQDNYQMRKSRSSSSSSIEKSQSNFKNQIESENAQFNSRKMEGKNFRQRSRSENNQKVKKHKKHKHNKDKVKDKEKDRNKEREKEKGKGRDKERESSADSKSSDNSNIIRKGEYQQSIQETDKQMESKKQQKYQKQVLNNKSSSSSSSSRSSPNRQGKIKNSELQHKIRQQSSESNKQLNNNSSNINASAANRRASGMYSNTYHARYQGHQKESEFSPNSKKNSSKFGFVSRFSSLPSSQNIQGLGNLNKQINNTNK